MSVRAFDPAANPRHSRSLNAVVNRHQVEAARGNLGTALAVLNRMDLRWPADIAMGLFAVAASKEFASPVADILNDLTPFFREYIAKTLGCEPTFHSIMRTVSTPPLPPLITAAMHNAALERERLKKTEREALEDKAKEESYQAEQAFQFGAPPIPVDRRHALFSVDAYNARLPTSLSVDSKSKWLTALRESSSVREIPRATEAMFSRLHALKNDAPNLSPVIDVVDRELRLSSIGNQGVRLSPILLVGPPAAGKTWLAGLIAKALTPETPADIISLPTVTGAFELSGSNSTWNSAQPGRIVRAFIKTRSATPMFVLDEIEKAMVGNYPPAGVLLPLLESSDAARWRDEFFDLEFDVSRALFVATANSVEPMDSALLSRFRVIEVREPHLSEVPQIVQSLFRAVIADLPSTIHTALSEDALDILSGAFVDARQMTRLLRDALGVAAARDLREIQIKRHDVLTVLRQDASRKLIQVAASSARH